MGGRRLFEGQLSALVFINSLRKIIAPLAKVWLYFLIRSLYVSYLLDLTVPLSFKANSSEFESARTETIVLAIESKVNAA